MKLKQGEIITLKISKIDLISLDSRAESLGMNRSEFVKYCINQEIERSKNEADAQAKLNDFERLMATLIEINGGVHKSIETSAGTKQTVVRGIIQLQKALIELYPNNDKLISIFAGEK